MNNMVRALFIGFFIFISFSLKSQDFNKYMEVKCQGLIPKDFITLFTDKYKEDLAKINKKDKSKTKKTHAKFYLESNFQINEIVTSGNVLFNDVFSNYLTSIFQKIKTANPSLEGKNIRFYTSKSTVVNAYATHAGIILINIGLLAKINSEDEIAYIMCHEIAHCIKKHSIKQYTYNEKIDSEKGSYKEEDWETKMFSKANYSQQQESEADALGFEFYSKTTYKTAAAYDALACLKTYYLPFNASLNFSNKTFSSKYVSFSDIAVMPVDSIVIKEYENDSKYSTHPEIEKRLEEISKLISKVENSKTTEVIPNNVQKTAQFEMCHLYLEKGMNYHSIFCSLALLQSEKESLYLKDVIAKSVYALSQGVTYLDKHERNFVRSYYLEDQSDYKETMPYSAREIQQIFSFLKALSPDRLNNLAIQLVCDQKNVSNDKSNMALRLKDLLFEYDQYFKKDSAVSASVNKIAENDSEMKNLLAAVKDMKPEPKEKSKSKAKQKGIDRLIIISPEFRKFDLRKDQSYKYEASEKALVDYQAKLQNNAQKLDVKYDLLSYVGFTEKSLAAYNDLSAINAFLMENTVSPPNAISSKKDILNEISTRHKTDKLALMGTYSFHLDRPAYIKIFVLVWTGVVFPTLPYGLWYSFAPKFKTFNYMFVYDLTSEKVIFDDVHEINMNGSNGVITSSMYFNLQKLKTGKHE